MKKALERLVRLALDLLFPPRCIFCGGFVPPGRQVCRTCADEIAPSGSARCLALPQDGGSILCASLYPYEGKVRDSILKYKFQGERQNADYYAVKLAALVGLIFPEQAFDLVTWVPLSEERKKERGYDQAERIAAPLAQALGLPCVQCLRKVRPNRVQHLLGRAERSGNVRGAYAADGTAMQGKCVLLADDIVTTGSTLAECSAVLLAGGAASVFCVTVAHAETGSVEKT